MIDRMGIGRINKHAQHAGADKLHGVRAKQINGVAHAAIKLLHDFAELGAAQGLRPQAIVAHVGIQHGGAGKLVLVLRRRAFRPLFTERPHHALFVQRADLLALVVKRDLHGLANILRAHDLGPVAFVQLRADGFAQLLRRKRLGQVVVGTCCHALAHVAAVLQRGQQNHGGFGQRIVVAHLIQHLEAVQKRHLDIADDQVRLVLANQRQSLGTVFCSHDLVALFFQHLADQQAGARIIINHHDQGHNKRSLFLKLPIGNGHGSSGSPAANPNGRQPRLAHDAVENRLAPCMPENPCAE